MGNISGEIMNPIRKLNCHEICDGTYCLFFHMTGELWIDPIDERKVGLRGFVRCPYEWEISAVKK